MSFVGSYDTAQAQFTRGCLGDRQNHIGISEPDKNPPKGTVECRWFERVDDLPFFAGVWRRRTGDRETKKAPNIGDHMLFSIMTTEPNGGSSYRKAGRSTTPTAARSCQRSIASLPWQEGCGWLGC